MGRPRPDDVSDGAGGAELVPCSVRELTLYFLRLGTFGFGGPIALAGDMQRHLVEERRWIGKQDYMEGLALAQLSPGPLAAQLAMYIGWVRAGARGAALVGAAFVLPSFLMVLVLARLYVQYGGSAWIQGAFYGVGAAVVAIIARSTLKLSKMTLARDVLQWALFGVTALITAVTESEIVWVFVACGVVAMLLKAPRGPRTEALVLAPPFLLTGLHGPAPASVLGQIAWFFTKAGALVFGSGLAIVPVLHAGVVKDFGWLTELQFRDAVAVAMITPGPVVITSGFIGYLTAGLLGAVIAAFCTFAPPYVVVVVAARHIRAAAKRPRLMAFLGGVTASATGAIAGAAFILGRRAIVDMPTALLGGASFVVLATTRKLPEPLLILVAATVGLVLSPR